MDGLETIVRSIPIGSCPCCGHERFIVSEIVKTEYLTNRDGEIIDSIEPSYNAVGFCLNCNRTYPMKPTHDGFIPMTPLRLFMAKHNNYDYFSINEDNYEKISNPMSKESD